MSALMPAAARAAVDFTGTWTVYNDFAGFADGFEYTNTWMVVQSGTQLTVSFPGSPSGPYVGTIDPDTGVFDVPLPPTINQVPFIVCPGTNHFFGTVAPDGQTFAGEWIESFVGFPPGFECDAPFHYLDGRRPGCGSGLVDPGESCDDGNTLDGDCCSSTCQTMEPDGAACSDGSACTGGDQCSAGVCVSGGDACGPCAVCGGTDCVPPEDDGCQPAFARKAKIALVAGGTPSKDKLTWSWKSSGAVSNHDLGVPDYQSDYTLCVIDHAGGVPTLQLASTAPAGGTCGTKPCWRWNGKSWDYRDKDGTPDGLTILDLDTGDAGRAKLGVKGKGADLGIPSGALVPPVIVRLVRDDAPTCWESTHSTPQLNVGGRFKATSD